MSVNPQETTPVETPKINDKEINFRKQEEMFKRQIDQERQGRLQAEARAAELEKARSVSSDEDDDSEPYVDHKRLNKKLSSFEKQMDEKIERKAEQKASMMLAKEREQNWLKTNPDFYEVMSHAQTLADRDPELAETILSMPEGFERQKLVYKNIKNLGLHKKEEPKSSIQDKIDANRKSPYYQPSGVGASPYSAAGDFSPSGQKNAYQKMQELKKNLRI